ncbi:MAG TPA: class I SAM-dependent methyltransferase [Candidatus Sulfotelmatobacter sp.]|nr:class I SAM-dependent methyltransferase [Candidatus Sulfotelmatobacter sp.]
MSAVDFITRVHTATKRNYLQRVVEHDKAECAEIAANFGYDYWDGDRRYGYGGMRYDGRWRPIAEEMIRHYGLDANARILDIGCGKGFLLYEFARLLPGAEIKGIDISAYAIQNAKAEVQPFLQVGNASRLPFADKSFDFVVAINTFHNLYAYDLHAALKEMQRVGLGAKYLTVEAYRDEREKANLMYWQLTCRAFMTPAEWEWTFAQAGYDGDFGFIFFE